MFKLFWLRWVRKHYLKKFGGSETKLLISRMIYETERGLLIDKESLIRAKIIESFVKRKTFLNPNAQTSQEIVQAQRARVGIENKIAANEDILKYLIELLNDELPENLKDDSSKKN